MSRLQNKYFMRHVMIYRFLINLVSWEVSSIEDCAKSEDASQVLPLVPEHHAVAHDVLHLHLDRVLDRHGRHILPTPGDNDFLLTTSNEQEPILVESVDVKVGNLGTREKLTFQGHQSEPNLLDRSALLFLLRPKGNPCSNCGP